MIRIENKYIALELDEITGDWLSLGYAGNEEPLVLIRQEPAFEVMIEGKPFFSGHVKRIKEYKIADDRNRLSITYERSGLRITHVVELGDSFPVLRQRVQIECFDGGLRKLTGVDYYLNGFVLGRPEDCFVQAPGQYVPPDSSYVEMAKLALDRTVSEPLPDYPQGWLEPAPDQTTGLIALENTVLGRTVSVWLYSDKATTFPTLDGDGTYINAAHKHQLCTWLKPGAQIVSETHNILFTTGTYYEHLGVYKKYAYGTHVSESQTPRWFSNARLLQLDPRPVVHWQKKLEQYRDMGFNTLYLLPVWKNSGNPYSLVDHYQLDVDKEGREQERAMYPEGICRLWDNNPFSVGTEAELKAFVNKAHALDFKVLFDFIPQGFCAKSKFVQEHNDWFVKDELERPFGSHGWGPKPGEPADNSTYSMDWSNPEYQEYIIKWAVWNVQTFDIDGFRTDAMHWKEPNFSLKNPRAPWETMFGGVRLSEKLRLALKRIKPDIVLMGEVWGPIFKDGHDATYENGWYLKHINEGWLRGNPVIAGAQWVKHLLALKMARPDGFLKMMFSCNHDSHQLAELAAHSPFGNTVSFMHMFSEGMPFIWHEELEGREDFFKGLLHKRRELEGYTCNYTAQPEREELFTAIWTKENYPSYLAIANPSEQIVRSVISSSMQTSNPEVVFGNLERLEPENDRIIVEIAAAGYAIVRL